MIPVYNKIICQIRIIARHCEFSCVFSASTANGLNHLLWSPGSRGIVLWKRASSVAWNPLCRMWHQKIRLTICRQPCGERRICTPAYLSLVIFSCEYCVPRRVRLPSSLLSSMHTFLPCSSYNRCVRHSSAFPLAIPLYLTGFCSRIGFTELRVELLPPP